MTIDEIRRRNWAIGGHWFDPDTMRFFGTRVHEQVYGDGFFVTSERDGYGPHNAWGGARRFTVRRAGADGHITTVGEFGGYASRTGAHAAARRYAEEAVNA
jgi:hypothetical protein